MVVLLTAVSTAPLMQLEVEELMLVVLVWGCQGALGGTLGVSWGPPQRHNTHSTAKKEDVQSLIAGGCWWLLVVLGVADVMST